MTQYLNDHDQFQAWLAGSSENGVKFEKRRNAKAEEGAGDTNLGETDETCIRLLRLWSLLTPSQEVTTRFTRTNEIGGPLYIILHCTIQRVTLEIFM